MSPKAAPNPDPGPRDTNLPPDAIVPAVVEKPSAQPRSDLEQWAELPAFDDGTAAFVEHFGLTAPRLKTDFGKNGNGFIDEQTGEKRDALNLVMLAFPPSRSYWAKRLTDGGAMGDPPDCRSTFGALTVPDADAPDRQAETCAACPHSRWTDEPPRCQEAVNVFAYDTDTESYYWVRFKRTALKPFRAYVSSVIARKRPLFSVSTNIRLKETKNAEGFEHLVPLFAMGELLKPAEVAPMRDVTQQAMKQWAAVAEELAASDRAANGDTTTTEASPAETVTDSAGEPF